MNQISILGEGKRDFLTPAVGACAPALYSVARHSGAHKRICMVSRRAYKHAVCACEVVEAMPEGGTDSDPTGRPLSSRLSE